MTRAWDAPSKSLTTRRAWTHTHAPSFGSGGSDLPLQRRDDATRESREAETAHRRRHHRIRTSPSPKGKQGPGAPALPPSWRHEKTTGAFCCCLASVLCARLDEAVRITMTESSSPTRQQRPDASLQQQQPTAHIHFLTRLGTPPTPHTTDRSIEPDYLSSAQPQGGGLVGSTAAAAEAALVCVVSGGREGAVRYAYVPPVVCVMLTHPIRYNPQRRPVIHPSHRHPCRPWRPCRRAAPAPAPRVPRPRGASPTGRRPRRPL